MLLITLILFLLMFTITDHLLIVEVNPRAQYIPQCQCHFLGNFSNVEKEKRCTWICADDPRCQTSVYQYDTHECSLYSEPCETGRIIRGSNLRSSVICSGRDPLFSIPPSMNTFPNASNLNCTIQIDSVGNDSYWSFGYNQSSAISAQFLNNASCTYPGIRGYGAALRLSANRRQGLEVYHSFNISHRSFTIMAWVNYNQSRRDMGIVGQCMMRRSYLCFHFNIRNDKGYFGFYDRDVSGKKNLGSNRWYHIAGVYDLLAKRQYLYIDGTLDDSTSQDPFQGFSSITTIGHSLPYNSRYFDGMIDYISWIGRPLGADEIFQMACLVAYYSFNDSIIEDSGPNRIVGWAMNVSLVDGIFNRSLFLGNISGHFRIPNLVLLGDPQHDFTWSFWIYPWTNVTNSTFMTAFSNGIPGLISFAFNPDGRLLVQCWNGSHQQMLGPSLTNFTWTHIALVYNTTKGLSLFINGTEHRVLNDFDYAPDNTPVTVIFDSTVNATTSSTASLLPNRFEGQIDELRLYSCSLPISEIQRLSKL